MEELICPITLEPIREAGITCVGSYYEYESIVDWLKTNNRDPLTNLELYTKFVVRFPTDNVDLLKEKAKDIALNTEFVDKRYSLKRKSVSTYERLSAIAKKAKHEGWDIYTEAVFHYASHILQHCDDTNPLKKYSGPLTGISSYQFIKFFGTKTNENYKGENFDFSVFTNCQFVNCNFSRVTFVGAVFNNVIFNSCQFIGEEVSFYKATGRCIFINCTVEHVDKWANGESTEEITQILRERHLDCQIGVI